MDKDFNFKVILLKINEKSLEFQQTVASLLAATFNVPEQETANLFARLPVVLLENLTSNDLKAIKDQLIFLSKLGLDFNITPKPVANITRTGWSSERILPVIHCPSCGESFCLVRAQDFYQKIYKKVEAAPGPKTMAKTTPAAPIQKLELPTPQPKQRTPVPASSPARQMPAVARKPAKIKAEQPALATPQQQPAHPSRPIAGDSKPKQALLPKQEDSAGISAEFDKVEILSAELQCIVDKDSNFEDIEEIEEVGSISEEMQGINNVSEELEELGTLSEEMDKFGGMADEIKDSDGDISEIEGVGGISAEFEEIEGVSAEFEGINLDDMDNDIGSLSAELEEIEGISAEFDSIESEEGLERIGEVSEPFNNIAIAISHHEAEARRPAAADHELDDMEGISQELEKIAGRPTPKARGVKGQPSDKSEPIAIKFETGSYKVMINFAGKGDIKAGSQLLATLRGITPQEAYQLAERQAAIIVAGNISQKAAENLLKQFQRFGMQGRIIPG